ncbi:MAG: DUF3300 domain-containing protein [Burkholderiaceae bacterium]
MKNGKLLAAAAVNVFLALSACVEAPVAPPASASPSPTPPPPPAPQPAAPPATTAPPPAATAPNGKTFSQKELDQLLAPIALYPDALLAQILMASTYPLEVAVAERWVKANPNLKGKALEDALQQQSWDPSVKSLTVLPQVLTMMSEKIDWTQKLGDAFLAQQQDVMATAQALRRKATEQGTLKESPEQKVITEQAGGETVIRIEPASPNVVYVPTYNPTVVYGGWPYPDYPPYYYYPPGYAAGTMLFGFTAGAIVGSALWGNCNWGGGSVNINTTRYNNFNRSNVQNGNWSHNAQHRGAVPYRDKAVSQQYGRGRSGDAASREQFRGRDAAGQSPASGNRGAGRTDTGGTRNASAFDTGRSAQTRDYSSRGTSSMKSAGSSGNYGASRSSGNYGASRSSGGYGGGARGGGGGGRGGGGRR